MYLSLNIFVAFRFDGWHDKPKGGGLSSDLMGWLYDGLWQPTIIAYYIWAQTSIRRLIEELVKNQIFIGSVHSVHRFQELLANKKVNYIALIISSSFTVWFVLTFGYSVLPTPYHSWIVFHPMLTWSRVPLMFIGFYALTFLIYDFLLTVFFLRVNFIDHPIQVRPFDPDGAGGLGSIGRFAANLGYVVGVAGIVVAASVIAAWSNQTALSYSLIVLVIAYFSIGPTLFIAPLWWSHKAMQRFKDEYLNRIAQQFEDSFAKLSQAILEQSEDIQQHQQRAEELQKLLSVVKTFPVWPFNSAAIVKFFSLGFSPFIVPISITLISEIIIRQLDK